MFNKIKTTVIIILLVILFGTIFFLNNKNKKLQQQLQQTTIENVNLLADADSVKLIGENLYQRLSYVIYSDSLLQIENDQLNKKLNGSTQQIVNLELELKKLKENIIVSIPDTIIENNGNSLFEYNFNKYYIDYSTTGKLGIYSNSLPDSISLKFDTTINPIKLDIYTKKLEEYKYEIYISTSSDLITLIDATSYISIDKPTVPFLSRFNAGLGIGMLNNGNAFVSGNIKYYNHNFGLLYSSSNGRFGGQYIYFWK